jgi:translocation and assembly module TamB
MDSDTQTARPSSSPSSKRSGWKWAAIVLVVALALIAAALFWLLNTSSGARTALSAIASLTGGSVQAEGVSGRLSDRVQMDRLVIDNPGQTITLSDVNMLWHPSELLQRRLHVEQLQVENLTVLQKEQEEDEPPKLPDNISAPLQLQIDNAEIGSGQVKNGDITLVELDDVAFNLQFDGQRYVFDLDRLDLQSAREGNEVQGKLQGSATLSAEKPYAIEGRFTTSAEGNVEQQALGAQGELTLEGSLAALMARADLNVNRTKVQGHVQLRPFSDTVLGDANLAVRELSLASLSKDLPVTQLDIDLRSETEGEGKLTIFNAQAGLLNNDRIPLNRLSTQFSYGAQALRLRNLRAVLGDGKQTAGTITGSAQFEDGKLNVNLHTQDLNLQYLDQRLRPTSLSGSVEMRHHDGKQDIALNLSEPLDRNRLTLSANASIADDVLTVPKAELRIAKGSALLSGTMQLDGKQAFRAEGELQRLRLADIGEFKEVPDLLLNGKFEANGALQPQLQGELSFELDDSRLAGHPLQGSGEVHLQGERLTIPDLQLAAGANRVQVQGSLSEQRSRLTFEIDAPQLNQLSPDIAGSLKAKGTAVGTLESPQITVKWDADQLRLPQDVQVGSLQGEAEVEIDPDQPFPLQAITAQVQASGVRSGEQTVEDLSAQLQFSPRPGAPLQLNLTANEVSAGEVRADKFTLRGDGTTARHTLTASGTDENQRWEVQAQGGLSNLEQDPRWQGSIEQLVTQGPFNARLRKPAPLVVSGQEVQLEDFYLETDTGVVALENFERNARGLSTRGRLESLQLGQLLEFATQDPPVRTDLVLSGDWNLRMNQNQALSGTLALRREQGDVVMLGQTPIPLGLNTLQLNARTAGNELDLQLQAQGAQLGRISVDATAYGRGQGFQFGPDTRIAGDVRLDVPDISWAAPLASPSLLASGRLQSTVDLGGTLGNPQLDGQIQGEGLRLFFADTGVDLRQGRLISRFDDSRLVIESLRFAHDDGSITVSGPIRFTEGKPQIQLDLRARKYRILNRADRRLTISGDSRISLQQGEATVTGKFNVDSGFFDIGQAGMPTLSDDVIIVGQEEKQTASFPLALDVQVGLGDGVTLTGQGLNAVVVGQVRLKSDAGEPIQAFGTLRIAKGTFAAYGRELAIERGELQFSGPINNPGLNILAMRRGQEVEAGVSIGGNVLAPRVNLVSEPPLSDAEKLSWLVFGRGLDTVAQGDLAVLQTAAGALLGGRESAGTQSQLASKFGLDTLSLSTSADGLEERIVTVGKQLSSRLYVSYRQGLENLTSVLLLRYDLTPRLTLEAEAGSRSALSLFYNIAFD